MEEEKGYFLNVFAYAFNSVVRAILRHKDINKNINKGKGGFLNLSSLVKFIIRFLIRLGVSSFNLPPQGGMVYRRSL